jgi:ABC-2 type transport system ATP-binding protein
VTDAPLSITGLTVRRGRRTILDDVTFAVRSGEILGIIGPNGAGKTTLFECIAGMQPLTSGSVETSAPRKETLFYVPDAIRPWPDQTVGWTLALCADMFGVAASDDLDLAGVRDQSVASLSKGETKRLDIAIGLIAPQPILFLDEPFDGLDLRQMRSVMDLLRRVAAGARTLVLSIHQLADAARVCDRLLLLNNGRVVAVGTLDELRARAGLPSAEIEEIFLALT